MKLFVPILILLTSTSSIFGSRILFLFPIPSKSHMIIVHALSTALAEKGHDVTVISTFPLKKSIKNHRNVHMPMSDKAKEIMSNMVKISTENVFKMLPEVTRITIELAENAMASNVVKEVLKEKFDLLVIGFMGEFSLLGLAQDLNCPVIMLSVQRHMHWSNVIVGNPSSVNAVPHYYISKHDMNFIDRVKNFMMSGVDILVMQYIDYHRKLIYDKYFPSPKYRSYDESLKNISLVLINDHFSAGIVRPNVPAAIEIRGIHIKSSPDELPKDIKKFLDEATNGAIYFSLGTNIKSDFVSEETFKVLLSVFSKLPQRVIMKWDNEEINGTSNNVLIKNWLPQEEILMHPNVKLFISHCGLGSIVESQYHGVPILGLPIFGDQIFNADLSVEEGWALKMDLKNLKADQFQKTIEEMLQNEKYSTTVKHFSRLYRDRPLSAKDTAVYWTEYVINHRGAKHLQYAAVHQNFWQRNSLDVIGFLLLCLYVIIKIFKFVVRKICKIIFKKSQEVTENKKKL